MKFLGHSMLILSVLALSLGCQESSSSSPGNSPALVTPCREFSTSTVPEPHCLVPYVALVANARNYDGLKIYTYAFLQVSERGIYGLSAERQFRAQPDFASCITLDPIDSKVPNAGMAVYSVAIAGKFEFSESGHCLGTIREPVIDAMQLETSGAS